MTLSLMAVDVKHPVVVLQNAGPAEVALVVVPSCDFKNFREKFLAQLQNVPVS